MSRTKQRSKNAVLFGSGMVVLSSIFYGSYGAFARLMGNSFGAYQQAWIRGMLVVLVMIPIALFGRQKWQHFRWREDKWWFLASAIASLSISAPLYYAYNHLGIGLSTLIMYAAYMISMFVFGRIFNSEKYTVLKFIATILAILGLILTFTPSTFSANPLAYLAALTGGAGIAIDMMVSQKIRYNSSQTTIIAWGCGSLLNLPVAFALHETIPAFHDTLPWIYLLAFVGVSVAGSWISIHGVKLIEAGAAGILGLLEIVWAIVFGIVLFNESPGTKAYVGAVLIIASALIPYIHAAQSPKTIIEEQII